MALTKDQIISIDAYLKKIGIKYWDIRLEMVDHLATQTEESGLTKIDSDILNDKNLKYKQELKNIAHQKIKLVNKKCRALFYNEFIKFFKSLKNLIFLLVFYILYFKFLNETDFKIFYRSSMIIIFTPITVSIGYMISNYIKKNMSIHLEYGILYFMFPNSIFNIFLQLLNSKGHFFPLSDSSFEIFLFLTIPIYLALIYIAFKVYLKLHKYYTKTFKDYLSVCH